MEAVRLLLGDVDLDAAHDPGRGLLGVRVADVAAAGGVLEPPRRLKRDPLVPPGRPAPPSTVLPNAEGFGGGGEPKGCSRAGAASRRVPMPPELERHVVRALGPRRGCLGGGVAAGPPQASERVQQLVPREGAVRQVDAGEAGQGSTGLTAAVAAETRAEEGRSDVG